MRPRPGVRAVQAMRASSGNGCAGKPLLSRVGAKRSRRGAGWGTGLWVRVLAVTAPALVRRAGRKKRNWLARPVAAASGRHRPSPAAAQIGGASNPVPGVRACPPLRACAVRLPMVTPSTPCRPPPIAGGKAASFGRDSRFLPGRADFAAAADWQLKLAAFGLGRAGLEAQSLGRLKFWGVILAELSAFAGRRTWPLASRPWDFSD